MAIPSTPTNFWAQQGNGQAYVLCDQISGATSYPVLRSLDNITFSEIAAPAVPEYLDTSVTAGITYYYAMAARNGSGTSSATASQSVIPVTTGKMTLSQIRLMAQQRSDRVNSNFITLPEWNGYINQAAFELYDLLTTVYQDYYVKVPYVVQTDGTTQQYPLPDDFYKLMGVDLGLTPNQNAFVNIPKFNFSDRNNFIYPQLQSTLLGVFNLRYRLVGSTVMFTPIPSAGQYLRFWYYPRMVQLLRESDILDGVSGWTEYVVVDAAIRALQKEESDVAVLAAEKLMLIDRINASAMNRDAANPDTISDTRQTNGLGQFGGYGNWGGY